MSRTRSLFSVLTILVLIVLASNSLFAAANISAISHESGIPGSSMTIRGSGFGPTQGTSTVTVAGIVAKATSWSDSSIRFIVPSNATARNNNVQVIVDGIVSKTPMFALGPSFDMPAGSSSSPTTNSGPVNQRIADLKDSAASKGTHIGVGSAQAIPASPGPGKNTAPIGQASTLSITSISPASALSGSLVTITGTGFGTTQGTSTVRFNSIPTRSVVAQISSWSANSIVAIVPTSISALPSAKFTVQLNVGGGVATVPFFLANPEIYGRLLPSTASAGSVVTIPGFNFGSSQGSSTVTVGGIVAQVTSWNPGFVNFIVPSGLTGTNNVAVTVGGLASNTDALVISSSPFISYFGPPFDSESTVLDTNSAPVGQEITINGANFGSTQGSSTVTFNGVSAIPTSWSAQTITVPVPTGATTGKIVVKVNGISSNGVEFMVAPPITEGGVGFVQGSYSNIAICDGSNTFMVVNLPADELAGDMELSVVAWRDTIANTVSTTGTGVATTFLQSNAANAFSTAGFGQTAVVYDQNVPAGPTNSVWTWNWCPTNPEVRFTAYKGVSQASSGNPATDFDGTPVLQPSSTSSVTLDSGFETTTNQNDLLIGIGMPGGAGGFTVTAPGANYTNRVITPMPGGNIMEDRIVTSTGSYDATATQSASGKWVMAMIAAKELPNQAPGVDAGTGQTINLPTNTATLDGTVNDDGLPNNTLTISWTKVSGPGTVTFSSPTTAQTQATFSAAGVYVLQLSGNDSQLSSTSNVTVTVNPQPISLALTPISAGPNVKGTTQTMTAVLTNGSGPTATPIANASVSFTVTGPNATTGSATTNASGSASFTYTGANGGTDTVTASYTGQNSNSTNVSWLVPAQAASTSPVFCQFFSTGFRPNSFSIAPGTTPAFTETFPSINFNATSVPGQPTSINQNTRPFFDVVTDQNGNFAGAIPAQGNGTSAGGGLFEFQMVCTGTFTVASAGNITFSLASDDAMIFGVGGGATVGSSNNPMNGLPPSKTSAFFNLPLMGGNDGPGTFLASPYVVNFPGPGNYPYEVDYVECCGFALFMNLTLGASGTSAPTTGTLALTPISPSSLNIGQTQTFTVQATDAGGAPAAGVAVALSVNGANQLQLTATTNSAGTATFQYSGATPGTDTIQASANVGGTSAFSGFANTTWTTPTGSTAVQFSSPGWIGSPIAGQVVQGQVPINIAGSCQCTLVSGTLTFWPTSNPSAVTTLNATFPSSNNLGTFDGTVLASGGYTIQLNATASNGVKLNSQVNVSVVGNNKLGRITSTVTEFKVPLAGIPISITRTYDSLDRSKIEDFGFGWRLGTFIDLSVDAQNNVTFNFNGQKVTFFFTPVPQSFFGSWLTPAYTPQAGIHGSLISNGCGGLLRLQSGLVCFPSTGQTYQPTLYQYTDPIGRAYTITSTGQLQSIKDLNGNTITVTPTGITSSVNGVVVPFVRDGTGRISQITDLNGKIYTYTYDTNGNLQSVQYPGLTAAETYTYATDHSLLTEVDPNGNTSTATYYSSANDGGNALLDGRLQSVTGPSVSDANGNPTQYTTQYSYNLSTNATTITNPDGGTVTRTDDAFGNPLTIVEAVNSTTTRTTTNQYDSNENLTKVIRPCGNTACADTSGNDTYIYTYDANGFQTSIQDPLAHTSRKTYNSVGGVLTATDAANTNTQTTTYDPNFNPLQTTDLLNGAGTFVSSSTFDSLGNLLTSTDANSKTTQYAYDPNGNLIQVTDPLNAVTRYTYDGMGRIASQTDALGNVTNFGYDSLGRLTTKTDALGKVTTYTYDNNGNKISEKDANNHTTQYQYDALNRLTLITYPDTTTRQYRYDFRGNKLVEIDQLGRKGVYTYDLAGELLTDTFASGTPDAGTVSYTYDLDGRQATVKDELNNTTTNTYDAAGNLITVKDALTNIASYGYDADNRKTSVQDANHNTTSYGYDKRSRLNPVTYPATATQGATTTQYTYDGVGRVLTTTDQAGKVTTKAYDAVGRLLSVNDALNNLTQYTYDLNGNLKFLKDAAGRVTAYQYDPLNRRNARTLPLGQFEIYNYDPVGNLATHTDFNGLKTTYAYDTLNRLLSKTPSSGAAISFTYTATGQRLTMTDPSGTTNYSSYDNRDRLLTKATPEGTLTYTYDAHGNVLTINSSNTNGASLTYTYDALNRLASVKDNRMAALGGPSTPTTYSYDPVGNLTGYVYPNTVQTSIVFDQLNRLTQTCSATSSPACSASAKLSSYAYTLGNAGNRTNVLELNSRNVAYGYDNDYRLQSEAITADPGGKNGTVNYVYDVVGNRSSMTSTLNAVPGGSFFVDANDRLTTDTYDNNGNTGTFAGIQVKYDFENRMIQYGTGLFLTYDGDGNRVSETIGGATTKYLTDDKNPTGLPQVLEELVNGAVTRTYTYGLQRISENQQINATWSPSFYGQDGHGNARFLTNSAGTVTDSYDYDGFGVPVKTAGTTPNSYLYSGERYDTGCGLYDLRARYYNQATGRFWARDPIEGDLNDPLTLHSYIYGLNNVINEIDPTGLDDTYPQTRPAPGLEYAALLAVVIYVGNQGVRPFGQTVSCDLSYAGSYANSFAQNAVHGVNPLAITRTGPCSTAPSSKPDPCPPLEQAIQVAMGEVLGRYQDLLLDVNQLFCFAYNTPNLGRRRGTWLGHLEAFRNAQQRLKNAVAAALANHCKVPPQAWELMTTPPPICPAGRIPKP